ncbi:hypothetical protein ACSFA3_19205 [Variovorax sp. RHLX14]|uniref:hypothetical protein n=1 Tax=Variovorax sp. RHLX14 TaxID=1259731 RepID=UPI003F46F59D
MIAPLLVPAAMATAALTLKRDTRAATVYVRKPKGTLYWGGAGLDGPYVQPQLAAFKEAGISHVSAGLTNTASRLLGRTGSLIDAARAGTLIRYRDDSEWVVTPGMTDAAPQFNLIGYSYGSLLAAQTAHWYARQAHVVDHVVLIASPIDADFLGDLRKHECIRKVIVIDLTELGDPIHAGISQFDLMKAAPELQDQKDRNQGDGHFYYAHLVRGSTLRWEALAKRLFAEGLR